MDGVTLTVLLYKVEGGLKLFRGEVAEQASPCVKEVEPLIDTTKDVTIGEKGNVANAVGAHLATIARMSLKCLKIITIEATKAVPCGKPQKTMAILKQLGDVAVRKTIFLVVKTNIADGLTGNWKPDNQKQQECHKKFSHLFPRFTDQ